MNPILSPHPSSQQQIWPLSHQSSSPTTPPCPSQSISTPLPTRRSTKKTLPSLVVYPPPSSYNNDQLPHPPIPTSTTSTSMATTNKKKRITKNPRPYIYSSSSSSSAMATTTTSHGKKKATTTTVTGGGVFLASPPPTATRLPNSDVLRQARLHQTFDFISGKATTLGIQQRLSPPGRLASHRVGFAEYGDLESGHPTMVIGGHGCSRLVGIMFEELAQRHGLRMIWPERPGYGLSEECSPQDLNALDWAEVVIQLADHLGIDKFSIIAQSVGTVFAMAVAHQYSTRIAGTMYMISPWVSAQSANTFRWTRRLPAALVTKTLSFAMDIMWIFNKPTTAADTTDDSTTLITPPFSPAAASSSSSSSYDNQDEENAFLASLEGDVDLPTDFPPHRPLRHMVRPRHISLYVAMNKSRMSEPYQGGQLGDVMVALEKYHDFGFSYDAQPYKVPVSAVWGDKDSLIPQRAIDCFANQIRDLRLKILDGEGHDLIWKEGVMAWAIRSIGERCRAAAAAATAAAERQHA